MIQILRELFLISILSSVALYLEGRAAAAVDVHVSQTSHGYNARISTAQESHTLNLNQPTGENISIPHWLSHY